MRWSFGLAASAAAIVLFVVGNASPTHAADGPAYQGSPACKKCHFSQHKSWKKSTMAKSFELLSPGERAEEKTKAGLDPDADYTADATCLPCHTTGYGKPGGFVSIEDTPGLAGVGCEMCHGPGEGYLEIMTVKNKDHAIKDMTDLGLIYPPREEQCGQCHNDTNPFTPTVDDKYAFTFDERVKDPAGTHKHKPMKGEHPDLADLGTLFQLQ